MQKDDIYKLGLVLGLNHTKLRAKMNSDTFLEDVIAAWLHEEDYEKREIQLGQFSLMLLNTLQLSKWGLPTKLQKKKDFHDQCFI